MLLVLSLCQRTMLRCIIQQFLGILPPSRGSFPGQQQFLTPGPLLGLWKHVLLAQLSLATLSLATRGEDWASQGQPKGKAEIPVVTRECRRNSTRTHA